MSELNPCYPKFLKGRDSVNGLAGYLSKLIRSFGQATVISGATTVVVADTDILSTDIIIASVQTEGTNASYVIGVAITAGTSFTIKVDTDPGVGGVVISYIVLRLNN